MAKLKAYGRAEIWKVSRENPAPKSDLTTWEKHEMSLMSDGKLLERRVVRFKPDSYETKGRLHDYGWKVKGRLKAEGDPSKLLETYQKAGYTLVGIQHLDQWNTNYAKALEASKRRSTKATEKRAVEKTTKHGKGFYIRNHKSSGLGLSKKYVAELGPYKSLDAALEPAWSRYQEFLQMKLNYLMPVEIVEADSRDLAEEGEGYVWWINGKNKGEPVSEKQLRLAGVNGIA